MLHKVLIYIYQEEKHRERSFSNLFNHSTLTYIDPSLDLNINKTCEPHLINVQHKNTDIVFNIVTTNDNSMPLLTALGCSSTDASESSVLALALVDDDNEIIKLVTCNNPRLTSVEETSLDIGAHFNYKFTVEPNIDSLDCSIEAFDHFQTMLRYHPIVDIKIDPEKRVNVFICDYAALSFDHSKEDKETELKEVKYERGQTSVIQHID